MISMLTSCQANQTNKLTWNFDGSVVNSNGKRISLKLQNAYDGLSYSNMLYVIGYKIDNEGMNHPTIAEISSDMSTANYWSFEQPLADIFLYQNKLHTNSMNGDSFYLQDNNWIKTNLNLPPNSTIVYSNNQEQLVICHPSSLFKSHNEKGGCYSTKPAWKQSFTWRTLKPIVCDGKLHIFETRKTGGSFKLISLFDGKILYSKQLDFVPENLCEIQSE